MLSVLLSQHIIIALSPISLFIALSDSESKSEKHRNSATLIVIFGRVKTLDRAIKKRAKKNKSNIFLGTILVGELSIFLEIYQIEID